MDGALDELLGDLPAIWLDGAKAVGKTATALQRAVTVRRLDQNAQAVIARADPMLALTGQPPVLLDEWHRVPAVWDAVKAAVDRDGAGGQYLLTGSASDTSTHSGAGRIAAIRMRPMTLPERRVSEPTVSLAALLSGDRGRIDGDSRVDLAEYVEEVLRSGFPAIRSLGPRARAVQLDGYISRIVDRDVEEAGLRVRSPASLLAWLRAYAAATSTTAAWETIRDAATSGTSNKPARTTTTPYIDALTRLRVIDELDPWLPGNNHLTRLGLRPKHHLVDPALAARLTGASRDSLLRGAPGTPTVGAEGTLLGALFESLCALSVRVFADAAFARAAHLRTHDNRHEVDLIVEREDRRIVAFEVKLGGVVSDQDVKHLSWLADRLGAQLLDSAVLTTGSRAYRRPDGIAVIPLALLGA